MNTEDLLLIIRRELLRLSSDESLSASNRLSCSQLQLAVLALQRQAFVTPGVYSSTALEFAQLMHEADKLAPASLHSSAKTGQSPVDTRRSVETTLESLLDAILEDGADEALVHRATTIFRRAAELEHSARSHVDSSLNESMEHFLSRIELARSRGKLRPPNTRSLEQRLEEYLRSKLPNASQLKVLTAAHRLFRLQRYCNL